ncbi:MAG: hypothetical protein IJQ50_00700, partial [Clostridia bacterium]|nr:hypothetical protein [Clostridia bacterium]
NFDPIDILSKQGETYKNDNGVVKWYKLPDVEKRLPKETEMFKKGEMKPEVYNAFDKLSRRWYYADTERARDQLSNLAQDVRNNNYEIKDLTAEANEQLWENGISIKAKDFIGNGLSSMVTAFGNIIIGLAIDPSAYGLLGYDWFDKVHGGGAWDYKTKEKKADWLPDEKYFFYHDEIIDKEAFGNLNYGYTGTILGLDPETLYRGGGKVSENPTEYEKEKYFGDTEVDHYWITQGINQANSRGYYGTRSLPVDLVFYTLEKLGIKYK